MVWLLAEMGLALVVLVGIVVWTFRARKDACNFAQKSSDEPGMGCAEHNHPNHSSAKNDKPTAKDE